MSLAHELRVLELESQVELLERLQLLTNFGSNLVTISGEQGLVSLGLLIATWKLGLTIRIKRSSCVILAKMMSSIARF